MTTVSSYFAKVAVDVDQASLKKVDALLKKVEKRLNNFSAAVEKTNNQSGKMIDRTATEARKVHDHQMKLMEKYNKAQQVQQEKTAKLAQKTHDHQLGLMKKFEQAQKASQDRQIKEMLKKQSTLLASRQPIRDTGAVFDNLQKRLAAQRLSYSDLSQKAVNANRSSFFANARASDIRTGQGSQYRLGEQQQQNLLAYQLASIGMFKRQVDAAKKLEQQRIKAANQAIRDEEKKTKIAEREAEKQRLIGIREAARKIRAEEQERVNRERYQRRQERLQEIANRKAGRYGGLSGIEAFGRFGVMGLPMAGGIFAAGIGLSQLNRGIQQYESQNLALEAVGGADAGRYSEYVNNLGNRLGITTSTLMPGFTQYLTGAQGTALEGRIQKDFESFTQYGAVMGLDSESMKGAQRAITQMLAKNQVTKEELTGQLAEHLPGALRLMADATTSGDTEKLLAMVKTGTLRPGDVLPQFFDLLRSRSQQKLPDYYKTTRFAQGSFEKSVEDLLKLFAKSGGSQGFTNFFKQMTEGARAAEPMIRGLAGAFENLSIAFQAPVTLFEELNKGLEVIEKQSGVSAGALTTLAGVGALMATKWGRVGIIFASIAMVLEDIAYGVQGKDSYTKSVMDWANKKAPVTSYDQRKADPNDPLGHDGPLAGWWQNTVRPAKDRFFDLMDKAAAVRDPNSPYFNDPKGYDDFLKQKALAAQQDAAGKNVQNTYNFGGINISVPVNDMANMNPEEQGAFLADFFKSKLEETMASFATP